MVALDYNDFGDYIGEQIPYAQPYNGPTPPPDNANIAVLSDLTAPPPDGPTIRDYVNYVWDFRHAFPWDHDPGDPTRALKVQNYQMTKAILVPYTYNRKIESTWGGVYSDTDLTPGAGTTGPTGDVEPIPPRDFVFLKVQAHVIIGYTVQTPDPNFHFPEIVTPVAPSTPYEALGAFIRTHTPNSAIATALVLDADTEHRRTLEIGDSWLADLSAFDARAGGPRLKSTSDNEMDVLQEQQCFYWDFDLDIATSGDPPFGTVFGSFLPGVEYPPPPPLNPGGESWLRNWQVTKGIRAVYHASLPVDPDDPRGPQRIVRGEILVGFSGGGGM